MSEQMQKLMRTDGTLHQVMLKVDGKSFRCHCGCNVFHHPNKDDLRRYECNACGEHYLADANPAHGDSHE